MRYGAGKLALLTTDSYRVGAQDQLRIYAKILGVTVHTVSDRNDLRQALESVRGRHLVLIDTVGIGQRDTRVAEQAQLRQKGKRIALGELLIRNRYLKPEVLARVLEAQRQDFFGRFGH